MNAESITVLITLISSSLSSILTWFLTKRKYNTEVDSSQIENLNRSLLAYQTIIDDLKVQVGSYIKQTTENSKEIYRLRSVVVRLLNNTCLDGGCTKRMFYTEEQIENILEGINKEEEI